jgi:hypothetical protein
LEQTEAISCGFKKLISALLVIDYPFLLFLNFGKNILIKPNKNRNILPLSGVIPTKNAKKI